MGLSSDSALAIWVGLSPRRRVPLGDVEGSGVNQWLPLALPAMACFAGAAVLLVFSMQMLALAAFPRLGGAGKTRAATAKRWLYELGLLVFLAGLGLFLWSRTWPATAIAAVSVVGVAIVADMVLVGVIWRRYGSLAQAPAPA